MPHSVLSEFEREVSEVDVEAGHFTLLHNRLSQFGHPDGSLQVITGLTRNIAETTYELLDRLVVISLIQEGRGLDTSGRLVSRIRQLGDC